MVKKNPLSEVLKKKFAFEGFPGVNIRVHQVLLAQASGLATLPPKKLVFLPGSTSSPYWRYPNMTTNCNWATSSMSRSNGRPPSWLFRWPKITHCWCVFLESAKIQADGLGSCVSPHSHNMLLSTKSPRLVLHFSTPDLHLLGVLQVTRGRSNPSALSSFHVISCPKACFHQLLIQFCSGVSFHETATKVYFIHSANPS